MNHVIEGNEGLAAPPAVRRDRQVEVVAAETFGEFSSDEIIRLDRRCETPGGRDPCTTVCTEETNAHR